MPRFDDEIDDLTRSREVPRRRRKRGPKLAVPWPVVVLLGISGLLILLAFAIRGAGPPLACVGAAMIVIGYLWFYLVALSDSFEQFLLCLLVPFYALFYLFSNFAEAKYPFGLNLLGIFVALSCLIAGAIREGISKDDPPKPVVEAGKPDNRPSPKIEPPKIEPPKNDPPKKEPPKPKPQGPISPTRPFDVDPQAKAAGKTVYLAALTPFAYKTGPWKFAVGAIGANGNEPLQVQGREYKYGISAHPPGGTERWQVSFVPGGEFKRFKGRVAINDSGSNPHGETIFSVYGDGTQLWESDGIGKTGIAVDFDIDVTGVQVLTLETRLKGGGSNHRAHAVWLDPWLER